MSLMNMRLRNRQEVQLTLNIFRRNSMKGELETFQVLLSEIDAIENRENRNLTEAEIIKVIRKQCESLKEVMKLKENSKHEEFQLGVLEVYLPTQLSVEETEKIVTQLVESEGVTDRKQFGLVMKNLPENVDKKIASQILNKMI